MHEEVRQFVRSEWAKFGQDRERIVEFGSLNVNGSVRELIGFPKFFLGIDIRHGRDVDIVMDACDFDGGESYDAVISTEALEHAEDPEGVIRAAWRTLKQDGLLLITAAAPPRAPHSANGNRLENEHYANVNPNDLHDWLEGGRWRIVTFEYHNERGDVYATALKP
jgi:SAM-dependent methyltransferase